MTNDRKHYIKLTEGQFQTLKRLTSGPPDLQTDRTRSLAKGLELNQVDSSGRHRVALTTEDLVTARYIFEVHALQNGTGHLWRFLREYGHLIGPDSV